MILKSDSKFEKKLTCCLENDMSNLANFHLSKCPFASSRKCMTLKFTEELFVMTMKSDTKNEVELTCRFEIDMRNFTNSDRGVIPHKRIN